MAEVTLMRGAAESPAADGPIGLHRLADRRLEFLLEASELLGASLDFETTMKTVARLAVPRIADGCAIHLLDAQGELEPLIVHRNPHGEAERALDVSACQCTVARTGEPAFYPSVEAELGPSAPAYLCRWASLGVASCMVVPLLAHGSVHGTITLALWGDARAYDEDDLVLSRDLARRAATAIVAARLHREVGLQKKQLDTLIESVPGVVWETAWDPVTRKVKVQFVSSHLERVLGFTPREWRENANLWIERVHPEDKERAEREAGELFKAGGGTQDYRLFTKDGRVVWLEVRVVTVRDAAGRAIGLRGISVDVTARKAQEAALHEANRAKDEFLAVLSHELRTPLTPMLTGLQILGGDAELPARLRPYVAIVERNLEMEVRLIDDLLDLNRIVKGKLHLNLDDVDVHQLIRQVVETLGPQSSRVVLSTSMCARSHHVRADPARLQQVLWNLLQNAIKFSSRGGMVEVRTHDSDSQLVIEVQDHGIGIEPAALPHIFNAFEHGEHHVIRRFGGLGLGLTISRGLVGMHGGTLQAASAGRDQGATFTITLPSIAAPATADLPEAPRRNDGSGRPVRILLVDDHADTLVLTELMLRRRGYDVTTADCVQSALAEAARERFDLLVSDIGLPDESGLELFRRMSRLQPVVGIALSGFGREIDIQRSKEAGFAEHLTKPVDMHVLSDLIQRLCFVPPATAALSH